MRCPDCAKFVPFDELRTDDVEIEINDSILNMKGTVYRPCGECGADLASHEVEFEEDLEDIFKDEAEVPEGYDVEYELYGNPNLEATERSQAKDRNGKQIKNHRYMKSFIGVSTECQVNRIVRDKNGKQIEAMEATKDITMKWEEQASGYESCC